MLNFKNTSLVFILAAVAIWLAGFSWVILACLFLIYLFLLFLGSYRVSSQFYMPVICKGKTQDKKIAISFDDGPLEPFTPAILDILKTKQVPAAFFCIGHRATINKELLLRADAEGHLVGNHSYNHHALFDLYSSERMEQELHQTNAAVKATLHKQPRLFRPPYGVTNPNLAKAVKRAGLVAVGWNIRSYDTVTSNEQKLYARLMRLLKPGAIILFHDTLNVTVNILPQFIDAVKQEGYEIVRLDKLINEEAYA